MIGKYKILLYCWVGVLLFVIGCRPTDQEIQHILTASDPAFTGTPIPITAIKQTNTPQIPSSFTPEIIYTPTSLPTSTLPTSTPTIAPGATQISPADNMVQVYIPAGEFMMGSKSDDKGVDDDEIPQHTVFVDAFWMDQTVVSNAMYALFLNQLGNQESGSSTWLDAGDEDVLIYQKDGRWQPVEGAENLPAVEISWFGAQAYCQWAGRRLPTEAEWEKAARGSTNRVYPWGDQIDCIKAQYANCGGSLLPVDSNPEGASPWGILGLSGNVWEWVADWYADDYYFRSVRENPVGPENGIARVLRGGSWEYDWKHLRVANRRNNGPAASMHDYGFRCALPSNP